MGYRAAACLTIILSSTWLFGCGGSSSETPWPAEPENSVLGPAGESGPGVSDERDGADAGPAEPRPKERAKAPAGSKKP